jgi:tetratricopeptide (TPR) repeat protein
MAREIPKEKADYIAANRDKTVSLLVKETGLKKRDIRKVLESLRGPGYQAAASSGILPSWKITLLFALVAGAAAVLSYFNALNASFHLDDVHVIRENPAVRSLSNIPGYFTQNTPTARGGEYYRPLLFVTYAWDFAIGAENDTVPYHVTSMVFHAGVGFMLAIIAYLLLGLLTARIPVYGPGKAAFAALAGALFTAHPLLTEAVTYLSGRSEVVVSFFILAALAAAILSDVTGRRIWAVASAVAFAAALFSKEYGFIFLPAYILIFFIFIRPSVGGRIPFGKLAVYAAILVAAVLIYMDFRAQAKVMPSSYTWDRYLGAQLTVVPVYLERMAAPLPSLLSFDYDNGIFTAAASAEKIVCGFLLFGLVVFSIWLLRRMPFAGFGLIFIFLALAPTSSVFPIEDVIFERRTYLAAAGFILVLLDVSIRLLASAFGRKWGVPVAATVLASLSIIYAAGSHARNYAYATEESLILDTIAKSPTAARQILNLGNIYYKQGMETRGKAGTARAAAQEKKVDWAEVTRLEKESADYFNKALDMFRKVEKLRPDERVYYAIGNTYTRLGEFYKAEDALNTSLDIFPNSVLRDGKKLKLYDDGAYSMGIMFFEKAMTHFVNGVPPKRNHDQGIKAENALNSAVLWFDNTVWMYEHCEAINTKENYRKSYFFLGECYYHIWRIHRAAQSEGDTTDYIGMALQAYKKAHDIAAGFGFMQDAAVFENRARQVYSEAVNKGYRNK